MKLELEINKWDDHKHKHKKEDKNEIEHHETDANLIGSMITRQLAKMNSNHVRDNDNN